VLHSGEVELQLGSIRISTFSKSNYLYYAACWLGWITGTAGVMRGVNNRSAISGERALENPHWRHLRNVPWVSLSRLTSPEHLRQDLKYSIPVTSPVYSGSI